METSCIFCKIIAGVVPAFYVKDTSDCIVIKDVAPKAPIHYLIISKIHVTDLVELNTHEQRVNIASALFGVAAELSQEDIHARAFNLVINTGSEAGQSVFHLHAHFLAGSWKENGSLL